jgi:HPt (histidine-containing phosphotransfer) domain-containing protein
MPERDGLHATKTIRAWEKSTGTHIPVIAMTAHAIKGDRERCLEAGMDGYTSKPIRVAEIEEEIQRLTSAPPQPRAKALPEKPRDDVLDQKALLEGVGGDRKLLRKLVRLFLNDSPQRLKEIKEAIRHSDPGALARAAHTLKGSIGSLAAKNTFAAAQRLETMGIQGNIGDAPEASQTLERELARLVETLRVVGSISRQE